MQFVEEFLNGYGYECFAMFLTALFSFIGLKIKNLVQIQEEEYMKKEIVENTVKYVEQLYKDLSSKEKYKKAEENSRMLLEEKNISISELELKVLIESACAMYSKNHKI